MVGAAECPKLGTMRNCGWPKTLVATMLMLGGCSHGVQSQRPTQAPSPQAAGTFERTTATPPPNVITPTPGAAAAGPATQSHATAPPIEKRVTRLAPDAPPQILGVSMTETIVHPGDTVSGSVLTTSNVASVQARIGGYAMSLSKIGVGRFALTYTVGPLPWFVRGNVTMRVIARNTRGDTVTREVPLNVR